jgi:hypothetical protein
MKKFEQLTYEKARPYMTVARCDNKPCVLFGTDNQPVVVRVSEEKNTTTFIYYTQNEGGALSYGEGVYEDFCLV